MKAARRQRVAAPGSPGQATIELLAGVPALLLAAIVGFQLLAFGYAAAMADHAAEAAALALATGGQPERAARAAVPGWPRAAIDVRARGRRVTVTLVAPSPLGFLRGRLRAVGVAAVGRSAKGS